MNYLLIIFLTLLLLTVAGGPTVYKNIFVEKARSENNVEYIKKIKLNSYVKLLLILFIPALNIFATAIAGVDELQGSDVFIWNICWVIISFGVIYEFWLDCINNFNSRYYYYRVTKRQIKHTISEILDENNIEHTDTENYLRVPNRNIEIEVKKAQNPIHYDSVKVTIPEYIGKNKECIDLLYDKLNKKIKPSIFSQNKFSRIKN